MNPPFAEPSFTFAPADHSNFPWLSPFQSETTHLSIPSWKRMSQLHNEIKMCYHHTFKVFFEIGFWGNKSRQHNKKEGNDLLDHRFKSKWVSVKIDFYVEKELSANQKILFWKDFLICFKYDNIKHLQIDQRWIANNCIFIEMIIL